MSDPTGSVPHNTARTKEIVDRLDDLSQTYDLLKNGREAVAAERFADVADAAQAFDLYIGNESTGDTDLIVTISLYPGGASQVTALESASVDTAGTAMPMQLKGTADSTPATVEYGGTYSGTNPITWMISGSRQSAGVSSATGGAAEEVRHLEPGEGIEYTATNRSGNTIDYGVKIGIVEVPI